MNSYDEKTIVLMVSCHKFKKTWEPFFTLFKKYWHDCPYEIIMGVDVGDYPNIKTIQVGKDLGWASNLIFILKRIEADRIILLLDDFFIYKNVDSNKIKKLVWHSRDFSIGCLRLHPCPGPTGPWHGSKSLGILNLHDKYRVSLLAAIWDKNVLTKLLRKGETPWKMEIHGTKRSSLIKEPFVSVLRGEAPLSYYLGLRRGLWQKDALKFLKKENINISQPSVKII